MLRTTLSEFVEKLREEFARRQKSNPSYSIRAYARDFDVDPSTLAKVLKGKLKPSNQLVRKFADRMGDQDLAQVDFAVQNIHYDRVHRGERAEVPLKYEYEMLLKLTQTRGFKSDPDWIARRLKWSKETVAQAIEDCVRLGWIRKTPQGTLIRQRPFVYFDFTANDEQWQKYREIMVEKMVPWALSKRTDVRVFHSSHFTLNPKTLPTLEKKIVRFHNDIDAISQTNDNTQEVYCSVVCVFPVTELQAMLKEAAEKGSTSKSKTKKK